MRIEFEGPCEPWAKYTLRDGGKPRKPLRRPRELPDALLEAVAIACVTGREVTLEYDGRVRGRVHPARFRVGG